MHWVTRRQIRVNRTATAWLIRRFIDADAVFTFVEPDEVMKLASDANAIGFDAPNARYPHKDERGRCSFEALVEEHHPNTTRSTRRLLRSSSRARRTGAELASSQTQNLSSAGRHFSQYTCRVASSGATTSSRRASSGRPGRHSGEAPSGRCEAATAVT